MNPDQQSALEELRKAVSEQKLAFLPHEPVDPAFAGLHQAVSHYDRLVSQLVMETLQNIETRVTPGELPQAQSEVDQQFAGLDAGVQPKAGVYRNYAGRLKRMHTLVATVRGW